jgi:thioredoxin 1
MITTVDELQTLLDTQADDTVIILDFFASWCKPCTEIMPLVEEVDLRDEVQVVKVNVEDGFSVAEKYSIASIPTLLFFNRGVSGERHVGKISKGRLDELIEESLKK